MLNHLIQRFRHWKNASPGTPTRSAGPGIEALEPRLMLAAGVVDGLRITEINYLPHDPSAAEIAAGFTDANAFEYIEFVNVAGETLDITGARFTSGLTFDFAASAVTSLAPGERVVIVANTLAFQERYGAGVSVAGQYVGVISDNGEQIRMKDTLDAVIQEFTYDNANG